MQGRAVKPAEVAELAALPGKPELYAQAAVHAAGADGPAGEVLNAVPRDLMNVLAADEKEERSESLELEFEAANHGLRKSQ